jgi:hypothetical protein
VLVFGRYGCLFLATASALCLFDQATNATHVLVIIELTCHSLSALPLVVELQTSERADKFDHHPKRNARARHAVELFRIPGPPGAGLVRGQYAVASDGRFRDGSHYRLNI